MTPATGSLLLVLVLGTVTSATAQILAEKPIIIPKPFVKPGSCPNELDYPLCKLLSFSPKPECSVDSQCPGNMKCCLYRCTRSCVTPLQKKIGQCPFFFCGTCATIKPLPYECHSDQQCPGTERCCFINCRRQCTATVSIKPWQCPVDVLKCPVVMPEPRCKQDDDCPGKQKCCHQCGMKCIDVKPENPGFCPSYVENLSCMQDLDTKICRSDADCLVPRKCCYYGGKMQCVKALNVKPGSCPASLKNCILPIPAPECESDGDCPDAKKCCTQQCAKQCSDPDVLLLESIPKLE
ncbi:WAP four-disulfide core domain protein 3-like isoform X1 [Bombina bombina]|uniref:WAP four-disulfide core domain protein 3-like isoform X1 n=1 Tax=Bombina bombina TaxID=8345 RepID=UPI00235B1A29|nr:WAP four-disulfide core domain protein 3-like isoform X1 [Bombina bombina]